MVGVPCPFFRWRKGGGEGPYGGEMHALITPPLLLARKIDEKGEIYINYFQERRNGRSVPYSSIVQRTRKGYFH